jgi:hypothetical protein
MTTESVFAKAPLETTDARFVRSTIARRWQKFQPNGVPLQSPESEHPLQRHGKIAAAFTIFCGKAAAEEGRHMQKIVVVTIATSHGCVAGLSDRRGMQCACRIKLITPPPVYLTSLSKSLN